MLCHSKETVEERGLKVMLAETVHISSPDLETSIHYLRSWYEQHEMLDVESLLFDEKIYIGANK